MRTAGIGSAKRAATIPAAVAPPRRYASPAKRLQKSRATSAPSNNRALRFARSTRRASYRSSGVSMSLIQVPDVDVRFEFEGEQFALDPIEVILQCQAIARETQDGTPFAYLDRFAEWLREQGAPE